MPRKGSRLHVIHSFLNVCERCGLSSVEILDSNKDCLSDVEIAERRAWRNEAEKASEAFAKQTRRR